MVATTTHMAFAGLLAAALLGSAYDWRAVAVVLVVAALPDLDSFIALVSVAGHRTVLHTLVVPAVVGLGIWADTSLRSDSLLRRRWGHRGVRVAWVSVVVYAVAGIGLDLVSGGVNPLYPLHDQFYAIDGKVELSDQRGIVQTFVETDGGGIPEPESRGTSQTFNYSTGVDPDPSGTETNPERIFPVVRSGWELLLVTVGSAVTWARLRFPHSLPDEE
jgi:hypothetical protein